jgi:hypothetical protein
LLAAASKGEAQRHNLPRCVCAFVCAFVMACVESPTRERDLRKLCSQDVNLVQLLFVSRSFLQEAMVSSRFLPPTSVVLARVSKVSSFLCATINIHEDKVMYSVSENLHLCLTCGSL